KDYDIYLYTTSVDGMPNIILEVAASGLPIVAINDGVVREMIIHKEIGILASIENIEEYIEALEFIYDNPEKARVMAEKAQELLVRQHSLESFQNKVARDIN